MGRQFTVEYDDFTGGHFVGDHEIKQPFNSWVGRGVCVTADEGFLMADGGWTSSGLATGSGSMPTPTMPLATYASGVPTGTTFVIDTTIYQIDTSGTLNTRGTFASAPDSATHAVSAAGQVFFVNGANLYQVQDSPTYTKVVTSLAVAGSFSEGVWRWKDWLVVPWGVSLYFSAPGVDSSMSFPSGNYIDIPGNQSITTVVPTADALYVATSEAWWSITGVLGETTVLRRLTKSGTVRRASTAVPPLPLSACEVDAGIAYIGPTERELMVLQGSVPFRWLTMRADAPTFSRIVSCADAVLGVTSTDGYPPDAWIWSETARRWRRSPLPESSILSGTDAGTVTSTAYYPVEDLDALSSTLGVLVVTHATVPSSRWSARVFTQAKNPLQPSVSSGGTTTAAPNEFAEAQVDLADYMKVAPFRVKEMLVEVDKGRTDGADAAARSLSAQLITHPIIEVAGGGAAGAGSGSSTQTVNFTPGDTEAGDREMVRFRLGDAGPTFTAKPRLTFKGVKIRRVILVCEDV